MVFTCRACAVCPSDPIVTLRFSCLSVCLLVHLSQSGEAWERVNGGNCHVWLFRVSWFVCLSATEGSKRMLVLSTVEAQLLSHKRNITKAAPEAREWQETGSLTTNKPRSEIALVLEYSVSCHDEFRQWQC